MLHLETPAPMQATSITLPPGDAGTELTIAHMRRLIDQGKKDPRIYELVAQIIRQAHVPQFDFPGEARAIYEAVRRNVRFTRDIRGKETLKAAWDTARLKIGDCDDYVILICSMLEAIGHQTQIVTVSNHSEDPDQFSHVYPEVLLNNKWVAVDAARRDPAFGRAPRNWFRKRVWDTRTPEFMDVAGLAGLGASRIATRLPRAWRPNTPPVYRQLAAWPVRRTRRRGVVGQGSYGRRAIAGLGQDDGFDWSSLPGIITAGETGAANIIAASRASPYNLFPTTSTNASAARTPYGITTGPYGVSPYGSGIFGGSTFGSSPFGIGGPSWTTILLVGIGLAVAVGASRR